MPHIPPVELKKPASATESDIISILVSIGRGIFQEYFTPTAFKKFDSDYKLTEFIQALAQEHPEVMSSIEALDQEGWQLAKKIANRNALAVLAGKPRVDFEGFIAEELGGRQSPAFQLFDILLQRMEEHENTEKDRILELIDDEQRLSEEDYLFILELFAYERCEFKEFQKLYKFIRSTQYVGHLIIASLRMMRNETYKKGFIKLVQEKGTPREKEVISGFM